MVVGVGGLSIKLQAMLSENRGRMGRVGGTCVVETVEFQSMDKGSVYERVNVEKRTDAG